MGGEPKSLLRPLTWRGVNGLGETGRGARKDEGRARIRKLDAEGLKFIIVALSTHWSGNHRVQARREKRLRCGHTHAWELS